ALLADAHAFRVIAIGAEGRGAGRADPFRAALMPTLLLFQTLLQRLHHLVPAAERLDQRLLLVGEVLLGELPEPFLGQLDRGRALRRRCTRRRLEPLEALTEDLVEPV